MAFKTILTVSISLFCFLISCNNNDIHITQFYLRMHTSWSSEDVIVYDFIYPPYGDILYILNLSDELEHRTNFNASDVCFFNNSSRVLINFRDIFTILDLNSDEFFDLSIYGAAPSIHPADDLIAYECLGRLCIYSLSQSQTIFKSDFFCLHPDWSPSGVELVYINDLFGLSIYDTSDQTISDLNIKADLSNPVWSPNDCYIAFTRPYNSDVFQGDIYVYDLVTENEMYITQGAFPEWSPDGSSLIFSKVGDSDSFGRIESHLYRFELDSGEVFQLTH